MVSKVEVIISYFTPVFTSIIHIQNKEIETVIQINLKPECIFPGSAFIVQCFFLLFFFFTNNW